MRSYKKIMPIFLSLALLGTAALSLNNRKKTNDSYELAMSEAREYARNHIVADAITKYQEAITFSPRLEAYVEAGNVYLENGEIKNAERWYNGELKYAYPRAPETYLFGIMAYSAAKDTEAVFDVYDEYQNRELFSQEVEDLIDPIRYSYNLIGGYDEVGPYSNSLNIAPVKYNGHWGYVDSEGYRLIDYCFKEAGFFSKYAPVKDEEGNAYYINTDGDVKVNESVILSADPEFGKVVKFGLLQGDRLLAYNGKIWNFYSQTTGEKLFGGFKDCTPIANGIGAVSMDGKKWALISEDGTMITDYIFDSVLSDDKGVILRAENILVEQDGKYFLVDQQGRPVGSAKYDAAYPFNEESGAAVKYNGKWVFIDGQGNVILETAFEEARSFSSGFAAVSTGGKWGYIGEDGSIVIDCVFENADYFSDSKTAFVKEEGRDWYILSLYRFNH